MSDRPKIGIYVAEDGATKVQYDGTPAQLLELLAILQATYLVDVTKRPNNFDEVFKRLQLETANKYMMFKTDQLKNKQPEPEGEEFMGGKI